MQKDKFNICWSTVCINKKPYTTVLYVWPVTIVMHVNIKECNSMLIESIIFTMVLVLYITRRHDFIRIITGTTQNSNHPDVCSMFTKQSCCCTVLCDITL